MSLPTLRSPLSLALQSSSKGIPSHDLSFLSREGGLGKRNHAWYNTAILPRGPSGSLSRETDAREENMGAASFLQTHDPRGERRRKRGQWGTWALQRGLEDSHSTEAIKTPILLKLAEESGSAPPTQWYHCSQHKSIWESTRRPSARSHQFLGDQVLRIADKGESLYTKSPNYKDNQGKNILRFCQDF